MVGIPLSAKLAGLVAEVDFSEAVLHGMLSFLLFAGALHVNLADLARQKYIIGTLATLGVIGSTLFGGGKKTRKLKQEKTREPGRPRPRTRTGREDTPAR